MPIRCLLTPPAPSASSRTRQTHDGTRERDPRDGQVELASVVAVERREVVREQDETAGRGEAWSLRDQPERARAGQAALSAASELVGTHKPNRASQTGLAWNRWKAATATVAPKSVPAILNSARKVVAPALMLKA